MTFERTRDYALVREIITNPAIHPHVTDDFCPPAEKFEPVQSDQVWYVLVTSDLGILLGLFMFVMHSPVLWEVHTCLLPRSWGKPAKQAARAAAEWVFSHTSCQRIITTVPDYNRLALKFALAAGMTEYGRNPRSYQKNGTLHDLILLGISKE